MVPTDETLKARPISSVPKVLAYDFDFVLRSISVAEVGSLGRANVDTCRQRSATAVRTVFFKTTHTKTLCRAVRKL